MSTRVLHVIHFIYQFWKGTTEGISLWSFITISQAVKEKMSFAVIVDDARRTPDAGHRPITIADIEHFVLRWAKTNQVKSQANF